MAKTDQEQSTQDGLDVTAPQPVAPGPIEADEGAVLGSLNLPQASLSLIVILVLLKALV